MATPTKTKTSPRKSKTSRNATFIQGVDSSGFLTSCETFFTSKRQPSVLVIPVVAAEGNTPSITPTYNKNIQTVISRNLEAHRNTTLAELMKDGFTHSGKAGEIFEYVMSKNSSIIFLGMGEKTPVDARKAGVALGRKLRQNQTTVHLSLDLKNDAALLFLNAFAITQYQWSMKSTISKKTPALQVAGVAPKIIDKSAKYIAGVFKARNLIHTPSNIKTPLWMANEVKKLVSASSSKALSLEVKSGTALKEFGGLLAVGNSSPKPGPRLIQLTYMPTNSSKKTPHVVIVGKGITFDTGGISLKRPYEFMTAMKSDMAGAAAAIATVLTAAELKLNVKVTAVAMCAENALSATSQRPSDVVVHYGGQTVEIINTDAEGRLVLADGLVYAIDKLAPDYLIDIATLTGAATLGLSRHYGALYTRNNELAAQLTAAGKATGEHLWHMPLVDDYEIALGSDVADMNHAADKYDFSGGSVTAALFLEKFATPAAIINKTAGAQKPTPQWAHLDIAGPARSEGDSGENVKGGTGFGVRVLTEWISTL
jgi:leucyl aminopeptidase